MAKLAFLALAFLALFMLRADAQTGRRVALVIGNGTYAEAGTLANPVNDALDVAAKLASLGFEVIEGHDLGKRALEQKIGAFSDALAGAEAGLFFYAGHGLQVDGRNFIVPVDARLDMPAKLKLEAVPIDDVLDIMEQQAQTSLVFLDACRNNPFARSLRRKATTRSAAVSDGLAQFDSTRGSFIAFSTAPGSVAMDGAGRNSPFAAALLRHIDEPGQSINDLMIAVRRDVISETRDFQRPWEQGSLTERFEFVPGGTRKAEPPAISPPARTSALERSAGDVPSIESFIRQRFLGADTTDMTQTVRDLYTDDADIYGTRLNQAAIVKVKADWFARFASWTFALDAASLTVMPRGDDRSGVVFAMSYEYVPKTGGRFAGKARVSLELVLQDGQWRIASESSEAIN
ncbi:hypothetical protein BH10PSE7_BH10PSE7_35100 [soil metagenome]